MQAKLAAMPQAWWLPDRQRAVNAQIGGREVNLNRTKPGVNTMFLIFSTRRADRIWELPLFRYFKHELEMLLSAVIGKDALRNIVRLQMAQMTAGAHIKPHRDAGPWAQKCASDWIVSATLCAAGTVGLLQKTMPQRNVAGMSSLQTLRHARLRWNAVAIGLPPCRTHRVHVVVKTHPGIAFYTCPRCTAMQEARHGDADDPGCLLPRDGGTCEPLDTSPDSIFEVRQLAWRAPRPLRCSACTAMRSG
jgi:hypothetical protein